MGLLSLVSGVSLVSGLWSRHQVSGLLSLGLISALLALVSDVRLLDSGSGLLSLVLGSGLRSAVLRLWSLACASGFWLLMFRFFLLFSALCYDFWLGIIWCECIT